MVPIIIRPVDWQYEAFNQLQVLPRDAMPVTQWPSTDEAWTDVARGVRKVIAERRARPPAEQRPVTAVPGVAGETFDQLVAFAEDYNRTRGAMVPGWDRTGRMEAILESVRQVARTITSASRLIDAVYRRGGDGDRVVALALLQVRPDPSVSWAVEDALGQSRSAFEQYHALIAAERLVPLLDDRGRQRLAQVINSQRSGDEQAQISVGSDRWRVSDRILASLKMSEA